MHISTAHSADFSVSYQNFRFLISIIQSHQDSSKKQTHDRHIERSTNQVSLRWPNKEATSVKSNIDYTIDTFLIRKRKM
jgi:hypothetical protein